MESEKAAIEAAFNKQLVTLWDALAKAYVDAGGEAQQEAAADQRFRSGVILARRVRDRAAVLLG